MAVIRQKLYIANLSHQHFEFCYRLPDEKAKKRNERNDQGDIVLEKNYRTERIPMGYQVLIGGGRLTPEQIAIILDQYEDKCLQDVTKLSTLKDYVGLCYRLDKPIDFEKLGVVIEQNIDRLNDRAEDRQEAVAAAVAKSMAEKNHELGTPLARTEIETLEDVKGGAARRLARGFEIAHDGRAPRHGSNPGPRARRNRSANA